MNSLKVRACGIVVVLAALGSAQAAIWTNEFSDLTGTNAAAVSNYTDTGGGNPNSYTVTFNGTGSMTQASPWLYQGDIGGGNKTAAFFNEPGTGSGRVRFSTPLPSSMDLAGGIAVAWRMRVGSANTGRGPIQIAATASGGGDGTSADAFNAYFRLQNSGHASGNSYIDIQRNGGSLYSTISDTTLRIDTLVLDRNIVDEFHQWTAAAVYHPDDNKAYWKLWMDGNLLLFPGPADGGGSPMLNGEQFSFRTFQEGFTGPSYLGLGDLNNQDTWDLEFDFVNYRDDGAVFFVPEPGALALLACGLVLLRRRRA